MHVHVLCIYICTSYYTPPMAYGIYCTRPEGAKRPWAHAVNDFVCQWRRVVTSLSQNIRPKKRGLLIQLHVARGKEGMAKRKQLSTNDLPPKSKGRFNFDLDGARAGKSSCYCTAASRCSVVPGLSSCTFNNCTFQFASLPAVSQMTGTTVPYHNDLTDIDPAELFDF